MIGIITIHRATNYGAVLQAYALKTACEALGKKIEIIDYRCKHIEDLYVNKFADFFSIKTKVKNVLTWDVQKERNRKFEEFIAEKLLCTDETSVYTKNQLVELNDKYDFFISGSDQIWNPFCTGNNTSYFLDFVKDNNKKYAYAASLGNIKDGFINSEMFRKLLSEYQGLSVREDKGQLAVQKMTGKDVKLHIDPTFLLEQKEWENMVKPIAYDNFVLVYSLSMPESIEKMARQYAKNTKKKIVFITLNNLFTKKHKNEVVTCTPEEFVSYFYYADCIFTNSFHGTAFSMIFNKEFYVERNANPNHDNSRLENILHIYGLEERMVSTTPKQNRIDYSEANNKRLRLREEALEYLRGIK